MRKFISFFLCLFLVACATATSQTPNVTAEELAHEQRLQKEILEKEGTNTADNTIKATPAMLARLERVAKRVHAAGVAVCNDLRGRNCSLPFHLDDSETDAVNAYTDGKKIVVTPAMMAFAQTDDQLATVLTHEYAHAIVAHPAKTSQNATVGGLLGLAVDSLAGSQGISTQGMFSKLGAQGAVLRYSQDFEREADYIGMYILKRANYDIDKAAHLWRRMAALNPNGIYNGSTHPTTAERYVLLEKTAAEIKAKQRAGRPLLPDEKPQS